MVVGLEEEDHVLVAVEVVSPTMTEEVQHLHFSAYPENRRYVLISASVGL